MGFYPKRIRRRQQQRNMKLIATAALSGCVFSASTWLEPTGNYNYNGDPCYRTVTGWNIVYADRKHSVAYKTKSEAAAVYLMWWYPDVWYPSRNMLRRR